MSSDLQNLSLHLAIENKPQGPFTYDEVLGKLQDKSISLETLAWHSALPEWKTLSELGFQATTTSSVPPLVTEDSQNQMASGSLPSTMDFLRISYQKTKDHLGKLLFAGIVFLVISMIVNIPSQIVTSLVVPNIVPLLKNSIAHFGLATILLCAGFFLGALLLFGYIGNLLGFGFYRYVLGILRHETDLVRTTKERLLEALLSTLLYTFVTPFLVLLGVIFFILPGIYLMVGYFFVPLFIMDQRMSFWSAMEASRQTVHQHWFRIFWYLCLLAFVAVSGILLLGIGLLFTIPMSLVGYLTLYEYLLHEFRNTPSHSPTS